MNKNGEIRSYVIYKMKNIKQINLLYFEGTFLTKKEAVRMIKEKENYDNDDIRLSEFEGREYANDLERIHRFTTMEVSRIPSAIYKKAPKTNNIEFPIGKNYKELEKTPKGLCECEGLTEDEVMQNVADFAARNMPPQMLQGGIPPKGYVCHNCNVPGHFIQRCPGVRDKKGNIVDRKVHGLPVGIPKSHLQETVEGTKGSYLDTDGKYYIKNKDNINTVVNITKAVFSKEENPKPITPTKVIIPPKFNCNICNNFLTMTLQTPCCKRNYCTDCIMNKLFDPEIGTGGICPNCSLPIPLIDMLIENKKLDMEINEWKKVNKLNKESNLHQGKCAVMPSISEIESTKDEQEESSDYSSEINVDIITFDPTHLIPTTYVPSNYKSRKVTPLLIENKTVDKLDLINTTNKVCEEKNNVYEVKKNASKDSFSKEYRLKDDALINTYTPSICKSPICQNSKDQIQNKICLKKPNVIEEKCKLQDSRNYNDTKLIQQPKRNDYNTQKQFQSRKYENEEQDSHSYIRRDNKNIDNEYYGSNIKNINMDRRNKYDNYSDKPIYNKCKDVRNEGIPYYGKGNRNDKKNNKNEETAYYGRDNRNEGTCHGRDNRTEGTCYGRDNRNKGTCYGRDNKDEGRNMKNRKRNISNDRCDNVAQGVKYDKKYHGRR